MKKHLFIFLILLGSVSSADEERQKNFETLVSTHDTTIFKSGESVSAVSEKYKVLNEKGRSELSLYKVHLASAKQKFNLLEATVTTGGSTIAVDSQSIRRNKVQTHEYGLTDATEIIIPISNLAIGSEVKIRYEIISKPDLPGIYSTQIGISNHALAKIEYQNFTSELPLKVFSEGFDEYFMLGKGEGKGKHTISVRPTPRAYALEGERVESALIYLTTADSWKQVNEAAAPLYQAAAGEKLPPALEKIIVEAKKLKTKKEMIEYSTKELTRRIAYSGDWSTTAGRMFPKKIKSTMILGKGDCKDYSTILVAVLRKLGFESHPFLTFRSRSYIGKARIDEMSKLPSPTLFNHVIVWARDTEGKVWWVDPTNPYVRADVITADILGNFGLLLDGKSDQAMLLPESNQEPANVFFEQTLAIAPDNSVTGKGKVNLSPSVYNTFEMSERVNGKDSVKSIISFILLPKAKNQIDLKKMEQSTEYEYSFHSRDWVEEQIGKYKAITVFNPIGLFLGKIRHENDSDLGEPGTLQMVTRITNQKNFDSIKAGCLVRSPWLDFDRYVENKSDEIIVTDIIKTKVRFLPKIQAEGDHFDKFMGDIYHCAKNSTLVLKLDDSLKTKAFIDEEKIKGPPFEAMTDQDAQILFDLGGPDLYSYRYLKVYRHFERKLIADPSNSQANLLMARSMANLGYLKGEDFVPAHLQEGLNLLAKGLSGKDQSFHQEIHLHRVRYFLFLNQVDNALKEFGEMNSKQPKNYNTYRAAHLIALKQNKTSAAELWLRASGTLATTADQKETYNGEMASLLQEKRNYEEAIPYLTALANSSPQNAWRWHNLACAYLSAGNYDKVIELEKKALSLAEFGAAKKVISDAYLAKANRMNQETKTRAPASNSQYEENLLEAVKYDDSNIEALLGIAKHYLSIYQSKKDTSAITRGYPYIKRAVEIEPKDGRVQTTLVLYKDAQKKE